MRKLIWACNQGSAGGYADRLKGIVTAYLLAKAVGREFFIEWRGVTSLTDAFDVPCAFDGKVPRNRQRYLWVDQMETRAQIIDRLGILCESQVDALYISCNQFDEPHAELATTHERSMSQTFARVLNSLLTPRPAITEHPAYLAAAEFVASHKAIGVQVRTGEYHNEDGVECADTREALKRVLQDQAPGMFIASDSQFWKAHLAGIAEIPTYQIHFDPAHIERSEPDDIRRTFLLTVIEHQILSKCSKVYTGWGGFGRTAAWWGGVPVVDLLAVASGAEPGTSGVDVGGIR